MRNLLLIVLVASLAVGCESKSPVGPGAVTVSVSTSTTTTTTIAPTASAQFVFAPTTPAAGQAVFFNAFGSTPGRGTQIVAYSWDFGDGLSGTGQSVSHTYLAQAIYVVTLTVTDDVGDTGTLSKVVGATLPPSTTTTIPSTSAARYVGNQSDPTIPSDLTLFFRLLAGQGLVAQLRAGLASLTGVGGPTTSAVGDLRYSVEGTFTTPNGTRGTIRGELLGTLVPAPTGTFTGTLTANPPGGCSATRRFSGPITGVTLQWSAGVMENNTCTTNPLGFSSLNLLTSVTSPVPSTTTTTSTTVPIPTLVPGTVGSSPVGTGLASATVYNFQFTVPASGGVPPYTYSWSFGDGSANGSGAAPTHTYANIGTFVATVTVADSMGALAQAQTPVTVGGTTGTWYAAVSTASNVPNGIEPIAIVQNQASIAATINDAIDGVPRFASGTGSVSNPRSLSIGATFSSGPGTPFAVTYVGTLNSALTTWSGTVTGYGGCLSAPCGFAATQTPPDVEGIAAVRGSPPPSPPSP